MEGVKEGYQSSSYSKWDCKYRVVFKKRRKALCGQVRHHLKGISHALAQQKECHILERHLLPDHVHMCITIPPKRAVTSLIGFLEGKSAVGVARQLEGKEGNLIGGSTFGLGDTRYQPLALN